MFDPVQYEKKVSELFEKHQSVQKVGFSSDAYKPGLEGMRSLDEALGNPSGRLRCIHVAGTNGKGSVCSMLAASLAASGYRVGLYTSPHLLDFRERIRTVTAEGSEMIGREDVWDFLEANGSLLEGRSFFEVTTAMAFNHFDSVGVDIAVIEAGLGGRLDSTNVIVPELSVITGIGLDHCMILGDTVEKIAREKAGIFKPGIPALVSTCDDRTAPVFEEVAARVHCPLFFADSMDIELEMPGLDLHGPCQDINFRTVAAALAILGEIPDLQAIAHTAEITGFRGRWERICSNPETICDIGHNPPALEHNFEKLKKSGRPLVIVYGVMADKDLDAISEFMPSDAKYVLVAPDTARAMDVDTLQSRLHELRPDLDTVKGRSVPEGMQIARNLAAECEDSLIYVGGSTFVVSEAIIDNTR